MSKPSFHKLAPNVIKVWQWSNSISNLFFLAIPIAYAFFFGYSGLHLWFIIGSGFLVTVFWILSIAWIPFLSWKNWRYSINQKEIDLKHGILFKTRTLIPLSRVQHVDTRQGPLLRTYKLSSVTISTAATTHEIPGLDTILADRVRRQISTYARLAEDDV